MHLFTEISRGVALAIFFVLLAACQTEPAVPELDYQISKSQWDSLPALEVRIKFQPAANEASRLDFSDTAWGQDSLWNTIRDFRVLSGAGHPLVERDSGWAVIPRGEADSPVEVSYKVIQDHVASDNPGLAYRPVVQQDYFHVFAHNLLMVPGHYRQQEGARAAIRISWRGWDETAVIHNSFGSRQRDQDLGILDLDQFMSAIYTGGDFRVYSRVIEGNPIHLAIRGEWIPFTEQEAMDMLTETVAAQRSFWKDHSQPYFTVTMRPFELEQGSSFQGTGLTNSFAASVSNNEFTDFQQLVYLFNHELMHNWVGHSIENEAEEAQYWFSEGFTEYYTAKNIAAFGIAGNDWGYYIEAVNDKIRQMAASTVQGAPNSEINYENFWTNRDYQELPYNRGFLFAFYLDQEIRAVSEGANSLDNLMRDLLRESRGKGAKLNGPYFVKKANRYLVEELGPFYRRHIEEGKPLPLEALFRDLGLEYRLGADLFDLGFDFSPERDFVVAVDPESAAYASGVRAGDAVVSRSIYMGATDREVELVLRRDGRTVPVRYLPKRKESIPQILDTPGNRELLSK
ncbi:M1 family aminopeptidase [Robiginitalea sp. SC105]|uniref:M1 family aminopeptidase n=1 Tax=Robiginitalea sp. SC105 TaxID=2762332 RepID=UPI00163A9812|nr:M1 family aminopeptidase [Robiginitalea sp. SC105]MBC2837724.1 hypothetical protein [Robiginitalea sp. SC105]